MSTPAQREAPALLTGDEIVISGISGIFPNSNSTSEFMENLFNQVDMVTAENLNFDHPEAPKHLGKISGTRKFDAQFFRVTYNQAITLEPMSRKLLEHAYTAMYDSGINPLAYKGRKVGVFVGSSYSDTANVSMYDVIKANGSILSGSSKTMFANRISFWIDGRGPSYTLDCMCSSSMVCLEHAYSAIKSGQCDAALVGGCNSCIHPILGFNLKRGGFLCLDGKTKCFDKNGDGCVRSEAISVLFLQKASEAKRVYMEICYADVQYGLKPDSEFSSLRKSAEIQKFLKDFYIKANVSTKEVVYVEAHGAAILDADANELQAIGEVFGKNNANPVYVGCVKSNMGNSEPASGACALTKMCLAYHRGELPANLHYSQPINIQSIRDGTIRVLDKNIPFHRGYTAVNNFSLTGKNCHALLKGHYKKKDPTKYITNIPRLVVVSGRQEDCVNKIFDILTSAPIDPEVIGMLHNIYKIETPGHTCRGYAVVDTNDNNETVSLARGVEYYSGTTKPLWLLFSGMGSQWPSMGAALMRIPTFSAALKRCDHVLAPKGLDIVKIITENNKTIFDKILNSFVGISAVQIGLIDVLKKIGVAPDFIIGHSLGEMACAYWDGSVTAEEMILGAYSRGIVSTETKFIPGTMAAVGLGYKDILPLCPPEIDIACHNSSESTTLSGPTDIMKQFIADLTSRGIFAREVPSSNIAFHSRYIKHAGPEFCRQLGEILLSPKARSNSWICTSIPQDQWDEPLAKFSSPEFFTNNLLSPVFFEETSKLIPNNAVVVEIAPHGLLQAIIKRSHPECTHIPLTRRGHSDPVTFLLEAMGKLYQEGFSIQLDQLYPKIDFPVSTETSLLSHYVEWEHSEDWPQAVHSKVEKILTPSREIVISVLDDDYKFLTGHIRDGKNIFPEAAILVLIWETMAMYVGCNYNQLSVVFSDIYFYSEIIIKSEEPLTLNLMINKGSNRFEVLHNNILITSGCVTQVIKPRFEFLKIENVTTRTSESERLPSEVIYKLMNLRGHCYKESFKSILSSTIKRETADIKWEGNWITFLDSLIQLNIFARSYSGVSVPRMIKQLIINTKSHVENLQIFAHNNILNAKLVNVYDLTRCAGVEIRQIRFEDKPIKDFIPELNSLTFVPHFLTADINLDVALRVILQIISGNVAEETIKIMEINDGSVQNFYKALNNGASANIPQVAFEIKTVTSTNFDPSVLESIHLVVMQSLLNNHKVWNHMFDAIHKGVFIVTWEKDDYDHIHDKLTTVVASMPVDSKRLFLLRKTVIREENDVEYVFVADYENFAWISIVNNALLRQKRVVLVSERKPHCGLLGLVKKLRKQYPDNICFVAIEDYRVSNFDQRKNVFEAQLLKNLTFNIFKKGCWGGYYYIPSPKLINAQQFHLTSLVPGDINSVVWVETVLPPKNKNIVEVYYAGLSVRDTQKAVGMFRNEEKLFGMDFSGIDGKGQKVMGVVSQKAIASEVQPDLDLLWPVPKHWSLEDAATVPLPYLHAYYCMAIRGKLLKGQSVFVNGGAGALGQAVISVALSQSCTIYTTVSDIQKKKILLKMFPQLNENNIAYSGHENFNAMVISNTGNKRCDWVISSLSGPLRTAAMKCVGASGVFQDVNVCDMENNIKFGMTFAEKERNYQSVLLSNIFKPENWKEKKILQRMIAEGIAKGVVRPLGRVTYSPTSVSRAFRLLSQRKNRGRVLLKIRDSENGINKLKAVPSMTYSPDGTYVIKCDSTHLGIELADRIIRHGARKVILNMDKKSLPGYVHTKLPIWRKRGASIMVFKETITSEDHCVQLLKIGSEMGRIEGIFILQECFYNQDLKLQEDVFLRIFDDTVSVVSMFDRSSKNNCPDLRHFVVISQSPSNCVNAYAIAASEKICQYRADSGLPALAFQINPVNQQDGTESDLKMLSLQSIFNSLEISMRQNNTIVHMNSTSKHYNDGILDKIFHVLGVKDISDVDENLTLNDFTIDEVTVEEMKNFIYEAYCLNYTTDVVKNMTLAKLKSLDTDGIKHDIKCENDGLYAFYSFIDHDEYMATDIMIPMKSILCKNNERDNAENEEDAYLFLIPGLEGHHYVFKPLCRSLKIRAFTFQLGPDMKGNSIREIAVNLKQFIHKRFKLTSKFYLLGYSFGINVALELASLFESDGITGVIFCLDSSPDAVRANINAFIGNQTDNKLEIALVEHIFSLMSGENKSKLNVNLQEMSWSEKVEACVNKLKKYTTYTSQYTKDVLDTAYTRIQLSRTYEPDFKLKSELVLMKGIPPSTVKLPNDYNLSKYSVKQVKIFELVSNHSTALYDSRVSNIVNKSLDKELLEKCKEMNLCDVYFTEAFVMK